MQEPSSARCSTVYAKDPVTYLPARAHLVLSVHSRNAHRVVLQMYDRAA